MLTKLQKQIKSVLQYTAFADIGLTGMTLVTWRLFNGAREILGDPNDIGFGWGIIFGGWVFYMLVGLSTLVCLAIFAYSFIVKVYLAGLVNKDTANVASFVVPLVIASFVTAAVGLFDLVAVLNGGNINWFIMVGMFAVEGIGLLWLSLWSGLFKDGVAWRQRKSTEALQVPQCFDGFWLRLALFNPGAI